MSIAAHWAADDARAAKELAGRFFRPADLSRPMQSVERLRFPLDFGREGFLEAVAAVDWSQFPAVMPLWWARIAIHARRRDVPLIPVALDDGWLALLHYRYRAALTPDEVGWLDHISLRTLATSPIDGALASFGRIYVPGVPLGGDPRFRSPAGIVKDWGVNPSLFDVSASS
ncbi:MAG: hypothetical protein [Microviridae sp.]|nr:MAG: hypothetical protein [Microviridae sp.]